MEYSRSYDSASSSVFESRVRKDCPAPSSTFKGFPPFNFIGGHNDRSLIPVHLIAASANRVLSEEGSSLAMYNAGHGPQGYPPLRKFTADRLNKFRGLSVSADDVLITSGSNPAIGLLCRILVQPGDVILCEEFCYAGALNIFQKHGAELRPIPVDDGGLVVDDLAFVLQDMAHRKEKPKFLYLIPTIQNPTGSIMSGARREALAALAKDNGLLILEDECYAELLFEGRAPPSMVAYAPDNVIHVGSFSKSLAPAIRLGYVVAPSSVLGRLMAVKDDGGTGMIDQMVAADYFGNHYEAHVLKASSILKSKMNVMIEAIDREFGTVVEVTKPEGGIFVWLTFSEAVDVRKLVAPAGEKGVVFNPGPDWAVSGVHATNRMRLCFAYPTVEEIREGVSLLAKACFETFGVPAFASNQKL